VAIAILAGALAALGHGSALALRAQAAAEVQTAAMQRARATLATIGRISPLQPGEQQTELANGWRQRVLVSPLATRPSERPAPVPYDIRLIILDRSGRELASLATVRLGPAR
jgi:hypothetical protein